MPTKRILIIDDEVAITDLLKYYLEDATDYEVRTANDGKAGVAAATEFRPDVIVCDYMMPNMDGGEVAAVIGEDPNLKDVPFIFLTGVVSQSDMDEDGQMIQGGRPFLAKPIDPDALVQCIERYVAAA